MSARSNTVELDLARIALRTGHQYDSDLLIEALGYCWEQLLWRKTDADLIDILARLKSKIDQ